MPLQSACYSYELYSKNKSKFQEEATRQLVGCIVLTRLVLYCLISYFTINTYLVYRIAGFLSEVQIFPNFTNGLSAREILFWVAV